MSEVDIEGGQRWLQEIGGQLEGSEIGICIITQDNFNRPWLNFEAGAISKSVSRGRPIPFLFDVKGSDVSGPILQFQHRIVSKDGMLGLVQDLNGLLGERSLPDADLRATFEHFWGSIEQEFEKIRCDPTLTTSTRPPPREQAEVLEEILSIVRAMQRTPPAAVPGGIGEQSVSGSLPEFDLARPLAEAGNKGAKRARRVKKNSQDGEP